MKKKYIKPLITFESLELSSNIAAGCSLLNVDSAERICPVHVPDSGITFFTQQGTCIQTTPSETDMICYHNGIDTHSVFSS